LKVIVIGAGIAGLGAATYFSRQGHTVTVFEANDRVGGRAQTLNARNAADIVDTGTQYFHTNYRRALALIRETGLSKTLSKIRGYTKVIEGNDQSGGFLLHHRYPWYRNAGIGGNLRLGRYLLHSLLDLPFDVFGLSCYSETDEINGISLESNRLVVNSIIRPLSLAGTLTEPDSYNLSQYHITRLIRIILLTDYLSLTGGIASLHRALAASLTVRLGTPASGLLIDSEKVSGVTVGERGESLKADHVVIAIPPVMASQLLPVEWREEREFLNGIVMPSFILPTFFLDRPVNKLVWSYLVHNRYGLKTKFITDASVKNPEMVKSGKSALQPWICYPESTALEGGSDESVIKLCMDEMEMLFPGFTGWIENIAVTRHPFGVPFHPPGRNRAARAFLMDADNRGLSCCGDYLSGGYLESALWSARRAADKFG
jgi:protoporphyrinogen oxidase